ncbi:DUF3943 domain-containing protein [Mucilaginibacter gilvus]|uniref:DUF3943 domain-containing protein n=1 Tax=Mucilaginibacter gilvus TaxID=2305909 RepID=A0A3S3VL93_9SPHI|nr:DUF3943 domain-containing protein [Mucilaginibacter gilvus]RWY55775.1 DUF3943 domain-containing protein [Mucilaginibacter gilvus]
MSNLYCPQLVTIRVAIAALVRSKSLILLCVFTFISSGLFAQKVTPADTIKKSKGDPNLQLKQIKAAKDNLLKDSTNNEPKKSLFVDTTIQNKYGDLLNDDIQYNKKYPIWKPAVEVLGVNVFTWSLDRFILNAEFSHIGPASWGYNFRNGWEWDSDRFGINFIGHPYTGSMYFNSARSQGYGYFQSIPFAVGGSLAWEYLGETTRPSYNDLINTTLNGAFLGEIFYRLSSNILDDRTRGGNRVFREIAAGLIDPVRGLNRLLQGKSFRHTNKEVYQKEPLNITLFSGIHKINVDNQTVFGKGPTEALINIQLDYGNPFEIRSRKPFDLFRLRTELSFGSGRKLLDNLTGYGVLFGSNTHYGKLSVLYGAFQYDDFWDNKTFELGALGFGGGAITKYSFSKNINLYTSAHVALVPLAGNSNRFGPDTSQVRDYTFNDGFETKIESTLTLGKYVSASFAYYYYFLHTFVGTPGNNNINILKPRLTVQIVKNLSIGFEHFIYFDDRYLQNLPGIHSSRTEQKIFLSLFLEDPQRKGRYN